MLEKLCSGLPQQIENQQPVVFRDALNRVAPIHLEWINSPEEVLWVPRLWIGEGRCLRWRWRFLRVSHLAVALCLRLGDRLVFAGQVAGLSSGPN